MSALLDVRALSKHYPGARALDGVDLTVELGKVHCIVGQNGAGKSTLIKCVAGLVAPTAGRVLFDGEPLPVGHPAASLALGVATIYQELDLVDDLTVAENLFLGHEVRLGAGGFFVDRRRARRLAGDVLARLGHGEIHAATLVGALKPAQKQMVSIARALTRDVRLLIMDEPTAVLDAHEVDALFAVVRRLAADGVGVIYISHRLHEAARIGDTITVLKDGRTVAHGLPPATPAAELVRLMVGRDLEAVFPDRPTTQATAAEGRRPVLRVDGLTRAPFVQDVSFDVDEGEIVGIGGLVGAGRTELLRLILGLDRPDRGQVLVAGRRLPPGRPRVAVRAGIGFAPEERKAGGLWPAWNLIKNVTVADLRRFRAGPLVDHAHERRAAAQQLDALDTRPRDPRRLVNELSGGNQQKVVLARWLLRECRVLLLDEPTRGVDVGAKAEIYRMIRRLADGGLAIVLVSSELAELVGLGDRILVMRDGRLVAELAGAEATEEQVLAHAVHPAHPVGAAG
ncbi:MAG: sugar ABC transporter ATP-binding protein [Acidimicrobiales bacterium]